MPKINVGPFPFIEQIEFLRQKNLVPTERWADLWREQHDHGFMVAGATKRALLADIHQAIIRSIEQGLPFQKFRKEFKQIVERHGWKHRGSNTWRARTIYETNLRTSYAAGRYKQQLLGAKQTPFWEYRHSHASFEPRPLHLQWDRRVILRYDDPWWRTHYPPNGYGCKCYVVARSERYIKKNKIKIQPAPEVKRYDYVDRVTGEIHNIPEGIDPGWDYIPGDAWVHNLTPKPQPTRQVPVLLPNPIDTDRRT